jgi:hypothetical protein
MDTLDARKLMVAFLRSKYQKVVQQVPVQHGTRKPWLIDAYIIDTQTYVEVDGVFWHGLDKHYDDLHPSGRAAYDRDRVQDEWFRAEGRRLVRVTDEEVLMCQELNDWSNILPRLEW